MSAFPSDLIYQANAARREELLVDATIERCGAQVGSPPSRGTAVIGQARRRVGWFLLTLGNRLVGGDGSTDLTPALKR